jgi:ubiquitin carboxyl-terminal hydrolase 7
MFLIEKVFIKRDNKWFKFDDDKVFEVDDFYALDENYGGSILRNKNFLTSKSKTFENNNTSAYMLVYIRKTEYSEILKSLEESEIPKHLFERFEKEKLEKERILREKEEEKKNINIRVFTDENLQNINTCDLFYYNENSINTIKLKKYDEINILYDYIQNHLKYDIRKIRLWLVDKRENDTQRINKIVQFQNLDVSKIYNFKIELNKIFDKKAGDNYTIFIEEINYLNKTYNILESNNEDEDVEIIEEDENKQIQNILIKNNKSFKKDNILLFIKYYNPIHALLEYKGYIVMNKFDSPKILEPIFIKILKLNENVEFEIFEEIRPDKVVEIDFEQNFAKNGLQSGNIK